jgi:hypothetical protein
MRRGISPVSAGTDHPLRSRPYPPAGPGIVYRPDTTHVVQASAVTDRAGSKGDDMAHQTDHPNRARLLALAGLFAAVVLATTAIAACGSSSKPASTATPNASSQGIKWADCIRSHGVPNFPDPNPDGSFNIPSSIAKSPAFQSTGQACASLRPHPNGRPPIISAQPPSYLANAKCMRKHGVPNLPDPTFGPGGPRIELRNFGPEEAAGIQLANMACAHVGTPVPLSGSGPGSGSGGPP